MRTQLEWNVVSQTPRAPSPSSFSTRSRISPAALFVKVTARMASGAMPQTPISHATRFVSTRVLPLPAPASTSNGPSVVRTASCCSGLRPSRSASASTAEAPGGEKERGSAEASSRARRIQRSASRSSVAAGALPSGVRRTRTTSLSLEEERARPGGAAVALADADVEEVAGGDRRRLGLEREAAFSLGRRPGEDAAGADQLDDLERPRRRDAHRERLARA